MISLPQLKPTRAPDGARAAFPISFAALDDIRARVRGEVRFGRHDRLLYATDASIYQVEPIGVIVPASVDDAVDAVRACAAHGLAMLPRGGGTSLAGQCVNEAVVIDLSARCTTVLEIDAGQRWASVEPGICVDDLNDRLRPLGLHFAPDPSTTRQANVGGCIGNNAAGMHSVLYGRTSDSVLGIDVCLADGARVRFDEPGSARLLDQRFDARRARRLAEGVAGIVRRHERLIRDRFPKTLRRSAGYQLDVVLQQLDAAERAGLADPVGGLNLSALLCGSEGTLAVTTGARLRLHPVPRSKGLAMIAFATLDAAIEAVLPLLETRPAAVEMLDDLIVGLARKNLQTAPLVQGLPAPAGEHVAAVLYVEYFGDAPGETFEDRFGAIRERFGRDWVRTTTDAGAMAGMWALRKSGEPLLHAIDSHRKPLGFIEDNAIPPERLGEFVRDLRAVLAAHGTIGSFYAHASVGVLHVRPLLSLRDESDVRAMHAIARESAAIARRLGGVMSGEHGDGRARGPLLEDYFGSELMDAFREVKALFDPAGLMNPGNIVSPGAVESISDRTRVRPRDQDESLSRIEPVATYFDYDDQHGFDGAIEMCNGAGVCRKRSSGTMCPSYMATLDERHATRGRANALRMAISGQAAIGGERAGSGSGPVWNDPETLATLDLCLSCKACKSECPSNVDIARLKAEYLAQGYREAGRVPLRAQVFGRIHELSAAAAMAPGLANWVSRRPPVRWLMNRVLGLAPERSLPEFRRPLWASWRAGQRASGRAMRSASCDGRLPRPGVDAPRVVLYGDTFTMYNDPENGIAARLLLESFGYRVDLFRGTDAARAMISVGMLAAAQERVADECERIAPLLDAAGGERVEAFLHLEPSVLSAITDDWQHLRVVDPRGRRSALAKRSMLVEHFIAERWGTHPEQLGADRVRFRQPSGRIVLHPHCHQKALWGGASSARALELAFPGRVDVLDAGCCGMAGSFGYTSDRYELSMTIGRRVLLPAVDAMGADDVIVAPGTSCRHQISDGSGRAVGLTGGKSGSRALSGLIGHGLDSVCHPVAWMAESLCTRSALDQPSS